MTTEPAPSHPTPYAPAPSAAPIVPKGTVAWTMGFLAYIPIPIFGSIVTGIVMAAVGNAQRRKGEVARQNGRNAANWGLTYLLATIGLMGGAMLLGAITSGGGGPVPDWAGITALTMVGIWAFPLQILHIVLTIMGTVKASKGTVFTNKLALPLLR